VTTALNGENGRESGFNIATGIQSSLFEGKILARLLLGQNPPIGGASASSAFLLASQQGIPIYGLHPGNIQSTLPRIENTYPKAAMTDAVNTGRVVIVPQRPPLFNGEPSRGYITLDPVTGEGAYLLGRADGGRIVCSDPMDGACQFWLGVADFFEVFGTVVLIAVAFIAVSLLLPLAIQGLLAALAASELVGLAVLGVIAATTLLINVAIGAAADLLNCIGNPPPTGLPPGVGSCLIQALTLILQVLGIDGLLNIRP
jgi:hypothetical protein